MKKLVIGLLLDDTLDRADGVQQAVISIGEKLRSKGHEVHYIVSETERTDLENVHSIGKLFSAKFNGNSVRTPIPVSNSAVTALFDKVKFDVLHVQMPYSPLFASKVLKMAPKNVKKFGTFHILPYGSFARFSTKILGYSLKNSLDSLDQVFAVSRPANQFMSEAFGVNGTVIPNPVDYEFFHRFKKQNNDKKQIVFIGRFEQRKGVRELIRAYSRIDKQLRESLSLIMCGKGPLLEEMKDLSKVLNLDIEFPGFVTDEEKAQYLANADVAVFPSISGESFGIVLTEAMSAGSGITIGGNNPGYSSVLEQWPETLFDPKDTEQFSKLLVKCLSAKSSVGKSQHQTVKQYDTNVVVDTLLEHYNS